VLDEVKELLQSRNKIAAIKHYREVNNISLTQARGESP
jgi:ribosomal protein L7/L12